MVGDDEAGKFALAELARAGVDLTLVRRSTLPTFATNVLVDTRGERLFLHLPVSSAEMTLDPGVVP